MLRKSSAYKRYSRLIIIVGSSLLGFFLLLVLFLDRFIEPILKDRLHTLIIQGSDSLYTYTLGGLKANFYGGKVEVENLQIDIDSNRYEHLKKRNALPSLTMEVRLERGQIKGIGLIDLLFRKRIKIKEIVSKKADIKLSRHIRRAVETEKGRPLWKSIQPNISAITVGKINLDGIKLLYKDADTSTSVKLQFDRCDAVFENIRIDSAAAFDTTRTGFTKQIFIRFHDLKYRTSDSTYKMKAEWITYSSKNKSLEIDSFKLQPTLEREDFYGAANRQTSLYYIEFAKVRFVNTRLDQFIHNNVIASDSVVFDSPDIEIYNNKLLPPDYESKIGKYPHQKLLKASSIINIKNIFFKGGNLTYSEKSQKTLQEGGFSITNLNLHATNVTNDFNLITQNSTCTANINGFILGNSPVSLTLKLYLDSLNGRYDAIGSVKNISADKLNQLAMPLANVQINSFNMHNLDFNVSGEDWSATSIVRMRYNNLSLTIKKMDEETGANQTNKFLTKILTKFVIWPDNPGPDGVERIARNSRVSRLTTQSFFGLLWKAIFAGMQDIMMKSGRYG